MLISLLNWVYILITTLVIGYFLITRVAGLLGGKILPTITDCVVAGLIIMAFYAQTFSLFMKVGLVANIVLVIATIVVLVLCFSEIRELIVRNLGFLFVKSEDNRKRNTIIVIVGIAFFLAVLFVILLYTSDSTFHYDTGLYHAQSIRWVEEYGVVKGLAILHLRFAYNSAYFSLHALYSMSFIPGIQSLHSLSGFIAITVCGYSVFGWIKSAVNGTLLRKTAVSDVLRLSPFFYLLTILIELTSPETDYVAIFLVMWTVLRFIELSEADEINVTGYALLAIGGFSFFTFKISTALIVLITIKPLVIYIRDKKWKNIVICGILAVLMIVPYVARNVMLCGWAVYPYSAIDLFDVPWKVDASALDGDAAEINSWARAAVGEENSGGLSWLGHWWSDQDLATRLFIKSLFISLPLMAISFALNLVRIIRDRFRVRGKYSHAYNTVCMMILMIGFIVFYLAKAPLIRYAYAPVLLLPLLVIGYVIYEANGLKGNKRILGTAIVVLASLVILAPSAKSVYEMGKFIKDESGARFTFSDYLVKQVEYPEVPWYVLESNGEIFYLPVEGDQMWYDAFPSTPYYESLDIIQFIGDDISDGFVSKGY